MTHDQLPHANSSSPRYQVIPRVLCFVAWGEEVLLIKGAANKRLWAGKYNGLGGHVERGESVQAAAQREIREEAGLTPADLRRLRLGGVVTIDEPGPAGIGIFVFTAEANTREVVPSAEGALEWVPRGAVAALDTVEDLPALLPLLFDRAADAPPFSAHYTYDADGRLQMALYSEQIGGDTPL